MEKCADHPNNIAVEVCKDCSKYICGIHDTGLCMKHGGVLDEDLPSRRTIIFVVMFLASITTILGSVIAGFLVSNDSVTETTSEDLPLPDLSTIILIFFSVALPILSIITVYLIRISREAKEPQLKIIEETVDTNKPKSQNTTFYCQQCGNKCKFSDENCPSCGKDIEDEKNLVS